MTARELRRLSDLLLRLYESYPLSPAEQYAVTQLRDLIYDKENET